MLTKGENKFLKECNKNKITILSTHSFNDKFYKKTSKAETMLICESLEKKGYLTIYQGSDSGYPFVLTYEGKHYSEISRLKIKSFFLESVLVPIVISLITALVTILLTS